MALRSAILSRTHRIPIRTPKLRAGPGSTGVGDHPGRPGADRIFVALYDTPPLPRYLSPPRLCRAIRLLASAPSLSAHSSTCPTRALGHTSTPRSTRQVTCLVPLSSRPATHHTPHTTHHAIAHPPLALLGHCMVNMCRGCICDEFVESACVYWDVGIWVYRVHVVAWHCDRPY